MGQIIIGNITRPSPQQGFNWKRRNAVPLLHGFRGRKSPSMLYKDYGLCYKHLDKCVRDVLTIISECMKHKIFIYSIYKYIIQYCLPVMSYIPIWHFTTSIMPTDSYKSESLKQVSKINGSTRFLDKRLCKKNNNNKMKVCLMFWSILCRNRWTLMSDGWIK